MKSSCYREAVEGDTEAVRTVSANSYVADEALKALNGETPNVDMSTSKRLSRKIDLNVMPFLCLIYLIQFLDSENTLSYASVMGLQADLKMDSHQYSWLGSVFYFGYLIFEYPANLLLQKLPLAKYTSFCIIVWGVLLSCLAAVTNFEQALAIRFLLGGFEATVTPSFALITSQYTKKEQGTRTGIWYSFSAWSQIFGGFVAYGIAERAQGNGTTFATWKIIFLFAGLLTVMMGFMFLFWMPDNQMNARWLSLEDRKLAIARIVSNQQGIGNKYFKAHQAKEALRDPVTWAFAFLLITLSIPGGGLSTYYNQLIVGLGFSANQSLLLGTAAGAFGGIVLVLGGYLGDRFGQRLIVTSIFLVVGILGLGLVIGLPRSYMVGRLIGFYLCQASPPTISVVLSLISSNIAGYTKKTTIAAIVLIFYCAGNIIGPQIFLAKYAPQYRGGEIAMAVCWSFSFANVLFLRWHFSKQNQNKAEVRSRQGYSPARDQAWLDLTDHENAELIYTL